MSLRGAILVCGLALLQPAWAAEAARPNFSGFWTLTRERVQPDPELARHVPAGTVVLNDVGAAEFGPMEFGGLKPKPEALAAARAWDPRQEMSVSNACKAPSIVYAVQGPFPIEIFQGRDLIVMRLEYFDMARVFLLDGSGPRPAKAPHTKVGYSVGHWEGDTLVVVTTHLKPATITNNGLEHSEQMKVTERFRLSKDGNTLMSTQEYDDPGALENRGVRYINWRRTPGDHVHAYDCDPSFAENYAAP